MSTPPLAGEDHVLKYVKPSQTRKDEHDSIIGVTHLAFRLRPDEDYLSACHVEHYDVDFNTQTKCAIAGFCATGFSVSKNGRFVRGNVDVIKAACAGFGNKVRIVSEPEDGHAAHVAIRQMKHDNDDLLELLASEAWAEMVS